MSVKNQKYLLWGLGAIFYAYENLMQISQGIIADDIISTFNVTASSIGILSSVYFWSYAILQIPIGLSLDRFSTKKPFLVGLLLCIMGTLLTANAGNTTHLVLSRLLIGAGSSFAALICLQIAADAFTRYQFSTLTGVLLSIGLFGQIMGEYPYILLTQAMGWRQSYLLFAIIALFLLLLVSYIFTNAQPGEKKTTKAIKEELRLVVKNKKILFLSAYGMLMFTPFLLLSSTWGLPFVMTKLSLNKHAASQILSYLQFGFIVGAPLLGRLSDRFKTRSVILKLSSMFGLLIIIAFIYLPLPVWLASFFLFAIGFFVSGFLPAFTLVKESADYSYKNCALGFMNTLNMLGGAIIMPLVGFILDYLDPGSVQDLSHFHIKHFQWAFGVIPLSLVLAIIFLFKADDYE